ncbi:MAG: hypothetical protein GY917_14115, partial [Planctomycetaceae bacterium]|nr:hypothetical protein [Planctomycetaceae bacterium]
PAILAGATCALLGLLGLFVESEGEILEAVIQPWSWVVVAWVIATVYLGLLLSTYVRHGGMLISAAILWIVTPMLLGTVLAVLSFGAGPGMEQTFRYVLPIFLILGELFVCMAVHRAIIRRLELVASQ